MPTGKSATAQWAAAVFAAPAKNARDVQVMPALGLKVCHRL